MPQGLHPPFYRFSPVLLRALAAPDGAMLRAIPDPM